MLWHGRMLMSAYPAPYGTPEALRQFIAENTDMARIQAELATTYASIGDDVGLEYAIRRLVAYTRAAVSTLPDLRAEKAQEARP
jgi:hypothetical protein